MPPGREARSDADRTPTAYSLASEAGGDEARRRIHPATSLLPHALLHATAAPPGLRPLRLLLFGHRTSSPCTLPSLPYVRRPARHDCLSGPRPHKDPSIASQQVIPWVPASTSTSCCCSSRRRGRRRPAARRVDFLRDAAHVDYGVLEVMLLYWGSRMSARAPSQTKKLLVRSLLMSTERI